MAVALAVVLTAGGPAALAASPSPSPMVSDPHTLDQHAIDAVRAVDPRFAGLETLFEKNQRAAVTLDFAPILAESLIHVLPTWATFVGDAGNVWAGADEGRIVEVVLTADCVPIARGTLPSEDPCGWRHSYVYRVAPTGEVTLLYEAGSEGQP